MTNQRIIKTYSELIRLATFEERFEYLKIGGTVGEQTFGFDRYLNQQFYTSMEWKHLRREVILRDDGCDLGIKDLEIVGPIYIHHINPITVDDIINRTDFLLNPNYLICCSDLTHKALHYGDYNMLPKGPVIRTKNDTCPWRH